MKIYIQEFREALHLGTVVAMASGLKSGMNCKQSLSLFEIADAQHICQLPVIIIVKPLKKVH
jgi:hypothetical protein